VVAEGRTPPTHFVSSITYGAKVNLIFELECSDAVEKRKVSGTLRVRLLEGLGTRLLEGMGGEGAVDLSGLSESQKSRLRVKFSGDLEASATPVAMTLAEAERLIRDIPGRLAASGGVPIVVSLEPVRRYF